MVESKKKHTKVNKARIAHKLAKYVRATPVHLSTTLSSAQPSHSHLIRGGPVKKKHRNSAKTWYPADDEGKLFKRKRNQPKPYQGRKSIQPGNVVIILSGKHRGRRVVALKYTKTGALLVTGPYSLNGVPLRRVTPAYVMATSTKVDLAGVKADFDDSFFKKQFTLSRNELKNATESQKNALEKGKTDSKSWKEQAAKTQKDLDTALLANIKKVENLKDYLRTRFTLYKNTRPHELKFWSSIFKHYENIFKLTDENMIYIG